MIDIRVRGYVLAPNVIGYVTFFPLLFDVVFRIPFMEPLHGLLEFGLFHSNTVKFVGDLLVH